MHSDFLENLDEEPRIDLTPLIDCLFMLIIFFVLTMSFSRPVLDLVLPQAANAVPVRERNELALTVKADGTYELAGEACDLEALGRALYADPERLLNIYMDERAPFASFVAVMDLAKEKRGGKFVISTRADGEGGANASSAGAIEGRTVEAAAHGTPNSEVDR